MDQLIKIDRAVVVVTRGRVPCQHEARRRRRVLHASKSTHGADVQRLPVHHHRVQRRLAVLVG